MTPRESIKQPTLRVLISAHPQLLKSHGVDSELLPYHVVNLFSALVTTIRTWWSRWDSNPPQIPCKGFLLALSLPHNFCLIFTACLRMTSERIGYQQLMIQRVAYLLRLEASSLRINRWRRKVVPGERIELPTSAV